MQGNRGKLRNQIRGDRDGGRPCAFSRAGSAESCGEPNSDDNQEHHGKANIQKFPEDKAGNSVGRSVMDERVLRKYSGIIRKPGYDNTIYTESREKREKLQENI